MNCLDCPYIEKELNKLLVSESRLHNSFTEEEIFLYTVQMCWCDKVGGRIHKMGLCDDCIDKISSIPSQTKRNHRNNHKMGNKRRRLYKYNKKLQKLHKINNWYPPIVIDRNIIFVWTGKQNKEVRTGKPSYKRIYRSNNGRKGGSRINKKYSNKAIRRYKGGIQKKGYSCHKLYDFWWNIY